MCFGFQSTIFSVIDCRRKGRSDALTGSRRHVNAYYPWSRCSGHHLGDKLMNFHLAKDYPYSPARWRFYNHNSQHGMRKEPLTCNFFDQECSKTKHAYSIAV